jgi:hypothetical protein
MVLDVCDLITSSKTALPNLIKYYFKNKIQNKMAGRVAQVVECLISNHKVLSLSPVTEKEKNCTTFIH